LPVAYISPQRIASESREGKAGQGKIRALQAEKTSALREQQQAITQTQEQLVNADPADVRRLELQLEQQRTDLQKATLQAQSEIQSLQRELSAAVTTRVRSILDAMLKGSDVKIVLQSESAVIWGVPEADLTNEVIKRLDAGDQRSKTP
jgi:Skp family chaperone for outer membrane proteins